MGTSEKELRILSIIDSIFKLQLNGARAAGAGVTEESAPSPAFLFQEVWDEIASSPGLSTH